MTTCARCGADDCDAEWGRKETLACRDRELANMRSLLRSVTGKLEEAHATLDGEDRRQWDVQKIIESVLEILA